MESEVTFCSGRSGHVLVMVLIVTTIGLLFGAGSLLLFRYQCQLRIDRQHELEKVYAVRSVLNCMRTYVGVMNDAGISYKYHTCSGRDLDLLAKPVRRIFPRVDNSDVAADGQENTGCRHFAMESGKLHIPAKIACATNGWYDGDLDYECGVMGLTNLLMQNTRSYTENGGKVYRLDLDGQEVTNGVKSWINIGMRGTGGWAEDNYGRRYYILPRHLVEGDSMRFCLIRNVTNRSESVGRQHGWPLSQVGERALVFEICRSNSVARMTFVEHRLVKRGSPPVVSEPLLQLDNWPTEYNMGFQIAAKEVRVFSVQNELPSGTCVISDDYWTMPDDTYDYFVKDIELFDGNEYVKYDGIRTNRVNGKIEAPELRAVFEVEASSVRSGAEPNSLTKFKVTPAYQYDIFLVYPRSCTNLATVAQRVGKFESKMLYKNQFNLGSSIMTYDTHGTENKGFRKDEREAERKRNRR